MKSAKLMLGSWGLEMNNSLELAHRFRADLVDLIEQVSVDSEKE